VATQLILRALEDKLVKTSPGAHHRLTEQKVETLLSYLFSPDGIVESWLLLGMFLAFRILSKDKVEGCSKQSIAATRESSELRSSISPIHDRSATYQISHLVLSTYPK